MKALFRARDSFSISWANVPHKTIQTRGRTSSQLKANSWERMSAPHFPFLQGQTYSVSISQSGLVFALLNPHFSIHPPNRITLTLSHFLYPYLRYCRYSACDMCNCRQEQLACDQFIQMNFTLSSHTFQLEETIENHPNDRHSTEHSAIEQHNLSFRILVKFTSKYSN